MIDWKYTVAMTGLTLVGAWVAGSTGSPSTARSEARAAVPAEVPASEIESEALRLEARVRGGVVSRALPAARNPFRFGSPQSTAASLGPAAARQAPIDPDVPAPPAEPSIKLIGMATEESPAGVIRTAILTGPSGLVMVTIGDAIDDLYQVTAIDADSVELTAPNGVPRRLLLRP